MKLIFFKSIGPSAVLFLILTFSCLFVTESSAQGHNLVHGWCRYAKPVKRGALDESLKAVCQACQKEKTVEINARKTEDARRLAIVKAQRDAELVVIKAAEEKKEQQRIANIDKGKVLINGNHNISDKKPIKNNNLIKKPDKHISLIFDTEDRDRNNWNIKTDAGDVVLAHVNDLIIGLENGIRALYENNEIVMSVVNDFPSNIAIVRYSKTIYSSKNSYNIFDLIDNKGNRHFNSDSICGITHILSDWFLVDRGGYVDLVGPENAAIYNFKTKERIDIPTNERSWVYMSTPLRNRKYANFSDRGFDRYYYGVTGEWSTISALLKGILEGLKWKFAFICYKPIDSYYLLYLDEEDHVLKKTILRHEF